MNVIKEKDMKKENVPTYRSLTFKARPRVMIVEARFYDDIGDMMMEGAAKVFEAQGADFESYAVPGALEIPAAMEFGIKTGRFDAYLALGCVIRGATTHYEIVSGESARALMDMSVRHGLCLGNGILTVENMEQAIERADPSQMDKGGGAAQAALEMLALKESLGV